MNIYDSKGDHLGSTEVKNIEYTEGAFMPTGAKDCCTRRDLQRYVHDCRLHLPLMEYYPSGYNGALPDDFRGLSEANLRFTAGHACRGLFEARKKSYLARPAPGPLRSTEGPSGRRVIF